VAQNRSHGHGSGIDLNRNVRGKSIPLAAFLTMSVPATARADPAPPDPPLRWDEERPRFRPIEYVTTGLFGGAAIAMFWWAHPQTRPHWIGGIYFDDAVRDALRLRSPSALQTVWAISDALDVSLVALVVGVDSLAVPVLRGSPDVAVQLGLMDAEAYAYSSTLTFAMYDEIGRARPSYEDCQRDPSFVGCNISPTASFPSGHTNEAFTAAGLSCANHHFVPLYGSVVWEGVACARDVVLATADGVLRIMGDRHYATDVLTGAAIGFGFGYGVPTLLHYAARVRSSTAWSLTPVAGSELGMAFVGSF
jgi:membrane-associated phospholipid phosphatase